MYSTISFLSQMWLPVVMTWAASGVFAVDDEEIDGVGVEDVGEVLAYDVAAGRSEDVADEENVHLWILARVGGEKPWRKGREERRKVSQRKVRERAVDCRDD
jgi:hypothetical protein